MKFSELRSPSALNWHMIIFSCPISSGFFQSKCLIFAPVLGKGLAVICCHNICYSAEMKNGTEIMLVFLFQDNSNLTELAVHTLKLFLYLHCDLCQQYVEV